MSKSISMNYFLGFEVLTVGVNGLCGFCGGISMEEVREPGFLATLEPGAGVLALSDINLDIRFYK